MEQQADVETQTDVEQQASPPAPPPAWYAQRPRRRWPWVAVPVAVVLLATGGFLVQHRLAATTDGAPTATVADPTAVVPAGPGEQPTFTLPGAGDAVVYLQSSGAVQRADLTSGAATVTPTPALVEPARFFAGAGWVASKTDADPSGFVVHDGAGRAAPARPACSRPAARTPPAPTRSGSCRARPTATAGVRRCRSTSTATGSATRASACPAPSGSRSGSSRTRWWPSPPRGRTRPARTVAPPLPGHALGVGTDAVLTWDCNDKLRCDARVNRPGRAPRYLPAVHASLEGLYAKDVTTAGSSWGVLSPDRRWVALALPKPTRSGARLVLVELKSGHRVEVPGAPAGQDGVAQAAWTPNGRYLLALTDGRLRAVDTTTDVVSTIGGTPAGLRHLAVAGTATG